MRNEALQGAVTTVERAYGQLAVAPFTPSWRNDYMLNTMLHHPWGPIIEYFAYVSQLQGIFPHETRASLHELRQWALATRERTETLLGLVYSRDWHQLKDTPAVREAFDSWLEQMALQDAGEQDEGYQAHRRGRAKAPQSWPGLWYSREARITEAEALARAQEFLQNANLVAKEEPKIRMYRGRKTDGNLWRVDFAIRSPAVDLTVLVSEIGGHVVEVEASLPRPDLELLAQLSRILALAWAQTEGEEIVPYRYHQDATSYSMEFVVLRQDVPLHSRQLWSYCSQFANDGVATGIRLQCDLYYDKYPLPLNFAASLSAEEIINSLDPTLVVNGTPHLTVVNGQGYEERLAYAIPLANMPGVDYAYFDAETGAFLGREPRATERGQRQYTQEWLDWQR